MASVQLSTMRKAVMDLYSAASWKDKVSRMPDKQVIAIYRRSEQTGLFDKRKKANKLARKMKKENERYVQLTIFDYMEDKVEKNQD